METDMRYLCELREGDNIAGIYFCKVKNELRTKMDKPYFSVTLQDKTGVMDAKVWDIRSGGIEEFESMDYIYVTGQVTRFQSALQVNLSRVRRCGEGEYDPADYMPMSSKNIDRMYTELTGILGTVKNPYLSKLLQSFFMEDEDFIRRFKGHSAAKTVHHSFIGGLLEHTLGVVKASEFYAKQYPLINRDLLLAAAAFHDIGKIEEISAFPANDYTNDGQLLGHIFLGAETVGSRIRQIPGFPPVLASELQHCILAHHGELEYGSPKKPALIEAVALNLADNADAKLQTMTELLQGSEPKAEWVGYNKLFESNIRRTDSGN